VSLAREAGRAGRWAVAGVSWLVGAGALVAILLAPWRWQHLAGAAACVVFVAANGWYVPRRAGPTLGGQAATLAAFFGGLEVMAWAVPALR
jgi:hypothetical protein